MSSLSKLVLVCHESSLVSSSFVIRLAVSSGMDVNRETTSKDTMISSGSGLRSLILVRKALALLIVWVDVLTRGWRIMARCLNSNKRHGNISIT